MMRTIIILFCFSITFSTMSQSVFVVEKEIPTSKDPVNALIIGVTEDYEEVMDHYKKFVKDNHDLKVKKENRSMYQVEAVELPHLSIKRGDLRTYLLPTDSMNLLAFSFVLGYDIFLSSEEYPEEMEKFKQFTVAFMEYHYREHFQGRINMANKELEGFKKSLSKSENKIHSISKKSLSLDKKITKEKDDVKKEGLKSDKLKLENEKTLLTYQLPTMRENVISKEQELAKLQEERNLYLQSITAL